MDPALQRERKRLAEDFASITGEEFEHFFCPLLYRDEDVDLQRGHIVNEAFEDADRTWTVQRADIDSFYGSLFESDFVALSLAKETPPIEALQDQTLSRKLSPKITVGGEEVGHYHPQDNPVPEKFSKVAVVDGDDAFPLALKISEEELLERQEETWKMFTFKDLRLDSLVSLLKVAHLTLFKLLGYRYALSPGGRWLGRKLGHFFLWYRDATRTLQRQVALDYFGDLSPLVRPIEETPYEFRGTVTDRRLLICGNPSDPWAVQVMVRTDEILHGVLAPFFTSPDAATTFSEFLDDPFPTVGARVAVLEEDHWRVADELLRVEWPNGSHAPS